MILVSIDSVREAGSTQTWRNDPASAQTLVEAFRVKPETDGLQWEPITEGIASSINAEGTSSVPATISDKQKQEMNESLYNLGNLRKRSFGDDD